MDQNNQQSDQLSIILSNALNNDAIIRQEAEKQIQFFFSQNFGEFLIALSKKLSTEKEITSIRQLCATLIKNQILKYSELWFNLSSEVTECIKNYVLSTLASNNLNIRKSTAFTIAGICKLEVPRGKWLIIFERLSNTAQNKDINIQLASLTTLEYIYEELSQENIPNDIVANLLNTYYSIFTNDSMDPQVVQNALKSLQKFLPFVGDFINDSEQRIKFYDLIEKYARNPLEQIRRVTLQIFDDIIKFYYDSLDNYIDKIFKFSQEIMLKDADSNKILCLGIWIDIGYEEDFRLNVINDIKKPSHNFLQRYNQVLSEICLRYIVTEDYENDEYTLSTACENLLSFMSKCCQDNFISNIITYIGNNINSEVEKIKYSALNVFRSIICTVHKNKFYQIVKDSLVMVSGILLGNCPHHFKILCASILEFITKHYGEELINDTVYFDKMISLYMNLFPISEKSVLCKLLLSLNYLCKQIKWTEKDETNILSKYMQKLCQELMKFYTDAKYYGKDDNVASLALFVLGTLGEKAASDLKIFMRDIFNHLTKLFETTLNKNNFNEKMANDYQEYLSSCMIGFLQTSCAEPTVVANLLNYIINSFQKRNDLYDEGISLIGTIALYTKSEFCGAMELISPYLIKGLRSLDSPDICKSSLMCLSDIIRGIEKQNKYVNDYLPLVMNILSDSNVERSIKPLCFNIISDIFLYCPNEAFNSFENLMKIIVGAMEKTNQSIDPKLDQDTCMNLVSLREHIIESISCIFSAVKDISKTEEFIPFVKNIIPYILDCGRDSSSSPEVVHEGLLLLSDLCQSYSHSYWSNMKGLLNIEIIQNMFNRIENDKTLAKDPTFKRSFDWAKSTISRVFQN